MIARAPTDHPDIPLTTVFALFGVNRSWDYAAHAPEQATQRSIKVAADVALRDAIEAVLVDFPGDGYGRVTKHLQRADWSVNHKRVLLIMQAGLQLSMSTVGNPYDNAKAESFFKTLKTEEVYLHEYQTFDEAADRIDQFIGDVYNHKRFQSSPGYRPPVEFETLFAGTENGTPSLTLVR